MAKTISKTKPAAKKPAPKPTAKKKTTADPFEAQKKKILKDNPTLTEDDFFRYGAPGDEDHESVLRRVADKLGKTYEDLLA